MDDLRNNLESQRIWLPDPDDMPTPLHLHLRLTRIVQGIGLAVLLGNIALLLHIISHLLK